MQSALQPVNQGDIARIIDTLNPPLTRFLRIRGLKYKSKQRSDFLLDDVRLAKNQRDCSKKVQKATENTNKAARRPKSRGPTYPFLAYPRTQIEVQAALKLVLDEVRIRWDLPQRVELARNVLGPVFLVHQIVRIELLFGWEVLQGRVVGLLVTCMINSGNEDLQSPMRLKLDVWGMSHTFVSNYSSFSKGP